MSADSLDPSRVAELYSQYSSELRAFLTGLLRNADLACETLQSTFIKVAEAGHTAQAETIKGWLFRVAYHEAMQVRRRQEVDQRVTRKVAWNGTQSVAAADEKLMRSETAARVQEQLELLHPDQRTVVRMRIYEEKTFAEIAAEIGVPLGTVVSRMRAALQKLSLELVEFSDSE